MATVIIRRTPQAAKVKEPTLEDTIRDYLVECWLADLGLRETNGKNRAPWIDPINTRLGVALGSPYCIGGLLVRGVERVCTAMKLRNPVIMTAGTQNFWFSAPEKFKKMRGTKAKKGDIGILVNKDDPKHGHAFGHRIDETSTIWTVEYNTSIAGSRDGDGVYCLERNTSGTIAKTYRGAIDVAAWIISVNG